MISNIVQQLRTRINLQCVDIDTVTLTLKRTKETRLLSVMRGRENDDPSREPKLFYARPIRINFM